MRADAAAPESAASAAPARRAAPAPRPLRAAAPRGLRARARNLPPARSAPSRAAAAPAACSARASSRASPRDRRPRPPARCADRSARCRPRAGSRCRRRARPRRAADRAPPRTRARTSSSSRSQKYWRGTARRSAAHGSGAGGAVARIAQQRVIDEPRVGDASPSAARRDRAFATAARRRRSRPRRTSA